jgi:hypothetical protein
MTRVVWTAVAAAVLTTATSASAQLATPSDEHAAWLRLTPVVGQAPQFNRQERWNVSEGGVSGSTAIRTRFASGSAAGGVLEIAITERVGLVGSGLYVARRSTIDFETAGVEPGSNFILAKAPAHPG